MRVALGSDHGGYALKLDVIKYLEERGIAYRDFGCGGPGSCDYCDLHDRDWNFHCGE